MNLKITRTLTLIFYSGFVTHPSVVGLSSSPFARKESNPGVVSEALQARLRWGGAGVIALNLEGEKPFFRATRFPTGSRGFHIKEIIELLDIFNEEKLERGDVPFVKTLAVIKEKMEPLAIGTERTLAFDLYLGNRTSPNLDMIECFKIMYAMAFENAIDAFLQKRELLTAAERLVFDTLTLTSHLFVELQTQDQEAKIGFWVVNNGVPPRMAETTAYKAARRIQRGLGNFDRFGGMARGLRKGGDLDEAVKQLMGQDITPEIRLLDRQEHLGDEEGAILEIKVPWRGIRHAIRNSVSKTLRVGLFVFNGVEPLDAIGPFEVFTTASRVALRSPGMTNPFEVFTVAKTLEVVQLRGGLNLNPHYTFANHPPIDVLIVPGGVVEAELKNTPLIEWIQTVAPRTLLTASVCTGAFLLAQAGLLNGQPATTHWEDLADLSKMFPTLRVLKNRRWVETQKNIVTSAGISAGIDMSLYLVSRLKGMALAKKTARQMEYRWRWGWLRQAGSRLRHLLAAA